MKTLAAILGGRCANGFERDMGSRVHAVHHSIALERGDYCSTTKAVLAPSLGRAACDGHASWTGAR